jgi:hypothetical protein
MVESEKGYTQYEGYTRKRRHTPANPKPIMLVERALRNW